MRKVLNKTRELRQLLVASVSTFFGFVILYPELFQQHQWLVKLADYAAAGGLAGFGVAGVRKAYRGRKREQEKQG